MLKYSKEAAPAIRRFDGSEFRQIQTNGSLKLAAMDPEQNTYLGGSTLDVSWLPFAAGRYQISPKIADYVITEIPIVTVGVPNRNLDAFHMDALTTWNSNVGRAAWQTFIGKPAHANHDNRVDARAKGVIFDARLIQNPKTGFYKIHALAGWDRTKDQDLVRSIIDKIRTGFSMGAIVGSTMCSYPNCGRTSPDGKIACVHMDGNLGKGRIINGFLIYEKCLDINFIELSSVEDPADHEAHNLWAK